MDPKNHLLTTPMPRSQPGPAKSECLGVGARLPCFLNISKCPSDSYRQPSLEATGCMGIVKAGFESQLCLSLAGT